MNDRYWQLEIRELVGGIISHDLANVDDIVIKLPADTCHSIGFWLPNFSENVTIHSNSYSIIDVFSGETFPITHSSYQSMFPQFAGQWKRIAGDLEDN